MAGAMENQIEPEVKENRYHELMALQAGISEEIHQEREDEELDVIVEGFDEENPALAVGRSYHEAPDIDGNIFIENAAELKVGQMVRVRILKALPMKWRQSWFKSVAVRVKITGERVTAG